MTTAGKVASEKDVFISYTLGRSVDPATALLRELGTDVAFFDNQDIRHGEDFVDRLLDAILGARVIVIFLDETYFERPYCWFEYEVATSAYDLLIEQNAPRHELVAALDHLVIVLPESPPPGILDRLPTLLQTRNWLHANQTSELAKLVAQRRRQCEPLDQQLSRLVDGDPQALRDSLKDKALPQPQRGVSKDIPGCTFQRSHGNELLGRRDELWRIHHELTTNLGKAHRTVALQGGPGIGKTTLAAEYVHRFGPKHYPGGWFWVRADAGPEDLRHSFHGILCQLAKDPPTWDAIKDEDMASVALRLRKAIEAAAAPDRPILYVVDGVPEPLTGEPLPESFEAWCPAPGSVSLLVTTRLRCDFEHVTELLVKPLSRVNARELLLRGVPTDAEGPTGAEWDEITAWVGRVPLALILLSKLLSAEDPRVLLDRARGRVPPRRDLQTAARLSSHRCVIEATAVSYERLPDDVKSAARLMAQFVCSPVPRALFSRALELLDPELAGTEMTFWLKQRSFVNPADGNGGLSVIGTMPPVVAATLLEMGPDPESELRLACLALTSAMPAASCRDPASWPFLDKCRPHAEHVFDRVVGGRSHWLPATRTSAVTLGLRVVALLRSQGRLAAAEVVAERAQLFASAVDGGHPGPQTLAASSVLAEIRRAQGRLDAARELQEWTAAGSLQDPALGADHPDTLAYHAQLVATMTAQGELAEAALRLEPIMRTAESTLGRGHPDTLSYKQQLAMIYASQARMADACALQREVVDQGKVTFGPGHPWLLRSNANLASLVGRQGDLESAYQIQTEVVAGVSMFPPWHPDRLEYEMLLVKILTMRARCGKGSWDEVIARQKKLLKVLKSQADGKDGLRPEDRAQLLARLHRDLGFTLQRQNDLHGARKQLQMALAAVTLKGARTSETLIAWNLFVVLEQLGSDDAPRIRATHLDWVLSTPTDRLDAEQRMVRELLGEPAARTEAAHSRS